eukprot:snap_masked-scaffold153_size302544-processed-gene-1.3 protein:Tk03372 transcript:snap_masked-scaffold153_size302544-processed-gene-1.3-mRNA-1 annotation:"fibroblast growth factor receptor 2"
MICGLKCYQHYKAVDYGQNSHQGNWFHKLNVRLGPSPQPYWLKTHGTIRESIEGGQAPYFISRERSVLHAKAAHNINLKCKAGGLPMPQVTWYKDNVLLYESLRRFEPYKINQRRLTIPNSTPYDNGVYKCVIANKYGQLEHNITVEVAPQIVAHHPIIKADSPANTTVPLGGNLTLQCDFEYFNIDDPPRIDWYRQIRGNKSIEDNVSASPLRLLQSCQMNLGCYNWTSHEQQHIINPQFDL